MLHAQLTIGRQDYIDIFRGLLIAHMALDHASLMFNAGRGAEELAGAAPPVYADLLQFLTRFTGVPVAPGFFFMAGFMVALTAAARTRRGVSAGDITRHLLIRGLVLLAADALLLGLPRAFAGFYSFVVLSSIGAALVILALIRHWPDRLLLPLAIAVLALHPLIDLTGWPLPLRAVLYDPIRSGAFRSLYPIVPWTAIVVLGYVTGRMTGCRADASRSWLRWAALSFVAFIVIRLNNGYGNAYHFSDYFSVTFWSFAKYPPDLAFLSWSFAAIFFTLAVLRFMTARGAPALLRPFVIYGRVPLFFYIVHFYVLGIASTILQTKFGLGGTYAVWLLLLLVMAWPCTRYYQLRTRTRLSA